MLLGDPLLRTGFEHIERKSATVEHFVMKFAQVEFRSQLLLSALAELADLELAEFVAERLSWPGNIAVGLGLESGLIDRAGFAEEIYNLIAAPAFGVNSRIHNKAHRSE